MKDKSIIIISILGAILILDIIIIILFKNIIDDKTLLINGYKSDRNVCRRALEELEENYEKLTEKYDKLDLSKN